MSSIPQQPCDAAKEGSAPALTFEQALAEIQSVLESLEDGSTGLEESLQRFERGTTLLRQCYAMLESAERRIELLTGRDADGRAVTVPFDADATHQPQQPQARRRSRRAAAEESSAKEPPQPGDSLF